MVRWICWVLALATPLTVSAARCALMLTPSYLKALPELVNPANRFTLRERGQLENLGNRRVVFATSAKETNRPRGADRGDPALFMYAVVKNPVDAISLFTFVYDRTLLASWHLRGGRVPYPEPEPATVESDAQNVSGKLIYGLDQWELWGWKAEWMPKKFLSSAMCAGVKLARFHRASVTEALGAAEDDFVITFWPNIRRPDISQAFYQTLQKLGLMQELAEKP